MLGNVGGGRKGRLPDMNVRFLEVDALPLQASPQSMAALLSRRGKTAHAEVNLECAGRTFSTCVGVCLEQPSLFFPITSRTATHLPGRSGISTVSRTSLPSPSSARSATNRNRPKFIFAPLITTANLFFAPTSLFSRTYCFNPASASAPAGSVIDRVSIPFRQPV